MSVGVMKDYKLKQIIAFVFLSSYKLSPPKKKIIAFFVFYPRLSPKLTQARIVDQAPEDVWWKRRGRRRSR